MQCSGWPWHQLDLMLVATSTVLDGGRCGARARASVKLVWKSCVEDGTRLLCIVIGRLSGGRANEESVA